MPDNDIFRWHIDPQWRKAACINLGVDEDPNGVPTVIRALGQEIKDTGCPGLPEIVEVIEKASKSMDIRIVHRVASSELDLVARDKSCVVTRIAADVALEIIGRRSANGCSRLDVAAQVLAGIAISRMFHPAVIHTVAEEHGVAYSDILDRLERRRPQIAAAADTLSMAAKLLSDPSGVSVKLPRPKRTRLPQADILHIPLTNL